MNIDKQKCVVSRIIEECPENEDLAKYIASQLEEIDKIKTAIVDIRTSTLGEEQRHKDALDFIDKQLQYVQKKCLHWSTTYYGDASGGNDSSTICDYCGKEVA